MASSSCSCFLCCVRAWRHFSSSLLPGLPACLRAALLGLASRLTRTAGSVRFVACMRLASSSSSSSDKPKRPLTSYMVFLASERAKVKQENPSLSQTEIVSACAKRWKALSEADRSAFVAKAEQAQASYQAKLQTWTAAQPPSPAKKSSAYTDFAKANFARLKAANPSLSTPQVMTLVAKEWKSRSQ